MKRWPLVLLIVATGCAAADDPVAAGREAVLAVTPGQTLLSDGFDVGNVVGAPPAGWVIAQPEGTEVAICDAALAPGSPPYAVELRDDSPVLRPEIEHAFVAPTSAGSATVRVRIDALAEAPLGVQLRTQNGVFLGAALVLSSGRVGYDVGVGTVSSDVVWTPGTWLTIRLDWFDDHSFDAYLGAAKFADRVALVGGGVPARLALTSGYGSATGRKAYVDAVVSTALQTADDFDSADLDFWVSAPPGTGARVVDSTLELVDDSPTARAEVVRAFATTPEGSLTLKVLVPSAAEAPFDLQLRGADGAFLLALRLAEDGKLAYNANPAGAGPFTTSSVAWDAGTWHGLRLDWSGQDRFSCFLDGAEVAHAVPFAVAGDPTKLSLIVGTSATTGRKAYVDSLALVRTPIESVRGRYDDNALWLAHCYTSAASCVNLVPQLLHELDVEYQVRTIFVNVGRLDASGALVNPAANLSQLGALLAAVDAYEAGHATRFRIIGWLNGALKDGSNVVIDLGNPATRQAIVSEAARLLSPLAPGSYVAGGVRPLDGVQLDLEPSGLDPARFASFKTLLQEIRQAWDDLGAAGNLGVAAHPLGAANQWQWSQTFYYEVAPLVDHIAAMTYTTGETSGPAYRDWIAGQTREILRAVRGESWGDAAHPPPTNDPRVFIGVPAMPASANHDPGAENVRWAAPGVDAAVSALLDEGSPGAQGFHGTAVYLHHDGSGSDGYASWATDWWWFGRHWLGRW